MNIAHAKAIPIAQILEKLGIKPVKKTANEAWFFSPFRKEKTASFKVNHKRNGWYDFGVGVGGDIIDLGQAYLASLKQSHSVSDVLTWLKNTAGNIDLPKPVCVPSVKAEEENATLIIKSVLPLESRGLANYLESRGIPQRVGEKYLKQARVYNTNSEKNFTALGLQNESGFYELRNNLFKGCVGAKDITFIRGTEDKPPGIHLFEGFMDFLSVITMEEGRPFKDDTIILNSLSCIQKALPLIRNYGYSNAYTWMDNDAPGKSATLFFDNFFKSENKLVHHPKNNVYAPFKDVNAWHMKKLEL